MVLPPPNLSTSWTYWPPGKKDPECDFYTREEAGFSPPVTDTIQILRLSARAREREREREREKRETERQRESSKRSGASLIREEKRRREQIASTPSSSSSSLVRLIPPLVWSPLSQIKLSFTSSSHIHIYVT